jgi:Ankyrin repeats (3 copies)
MHNLQGFSGLLCDAVVRNDEHRVRDMLADIQRAQQAAKQWTSGQSTPLHIAAEICSREADRTEILQLLVSSGIFALDACDSVGRTPLLAAFEQHNLPAAALLLHSLPEQAQADAVLHSDCWGKTALHYAARHDGNVLQVGQSADASRFLQQRFAFSAGAVQLELARSAGAMSSVDIKQLLHCV